MKGTNLPIFKTEETARQFLEDTLWPGGPVCPHCEAEGAYKIEGRQESKSPARPGLYKCKECEKQFTVTVGTIFEDSHIPLSKWLLALHLMCASKKGVSAHQLHRMLGITYKSAWFMAHRIRHAMDEGPLADMLRGIVEADETYVGGRRRGSNPGRGAPHKTAVFALVERKRGLVHSQPVEKVTAANLTEIMRQKVHRNTEIMTDDFGSYRGLNVRFKSHETVNHGAGEYVRGNVHTNTVEGYFSLLKRGLNGIYHHVSKQHLHRYLDEFNFRYNARRVSDTERTEMAIDGTKGKRLMYRDTKKKT